MWVPYPLKKKRGYRRMTHCDKIRLYVPSLDLSGLYDFLLNYTSSMLVFFGGQKNKKKEREKHIGTEHVRR